jgi:hypothetical protein
VVSVSTAAGSSMRLKRSPDVYAEIDPSLKSWRHSHSSDAKAQIVSKPDELLRSSRDGKVSRDANVRSLVSVITNLEIGAPST